MTGFRERAGGACVGVDLSRDGSAGRHHCSFNSSLHPEVHVRAKSEFSIYLANNVCPALVISLDAHPTQFLYPA